MYLRAVVVLLSLVFDGARSGRQSLYTRKLAACSCEDGATKFSSAQRRMGPSECVCNAEEVEEASEPAPESPEEETGKTQTPGPGVGWNRG